MANKHSKSDQIDHTRKIIKTAILSRLIILTLISFWRSLINPYDTSASLNLNCLIPPSSPPPPPQYGGNSAARWPLLGSWIEGSIVWDSVYFVRIAQCGYEYEQSYAFFPLLPVCINLLSNTVFRPLIAVIGERAVLGLSGYVINNIAFVLAAFYFYKLSVIILKDREASLRASILFCFNPASIFYSSIYTESLYALFSVGGFYYLVSGANNTAVLWLALSGAARSNGVVNVGYICFQTMHQAYNAIFPKKSVFLAVWVLLAGALRCILISTPFIAFQAYGYNNICLGRLSDETSPWCKAKLPLLYNYIQSHYWRVGFLKYFRFKQLPNFLLASPILSLSICAIIHYVKLQPDIFLSLGFLASNEEKIAAGMSSTSGEKLIADFPRSPRISSSSTGGTEEKNLRRRKTIKEEDTDPLHEHEKYEQSAPFKSLSVFIIPSVLHLGFMAATSFLVMHVQVSTRFLSASPPIYWFASYLMESHRPGTRRGYLIWAYCIGYILLGSLLFSNFYPFT